MTDEPHAVVQLLLKRMESHPEEFKCADDVHSDRWEEYVTGIEVHGNEADKAAIRAGMRDIRLAEIHEQVMDELMNGPERRAKEAEERELILKSALAQQQAAQQHQLQRYQNAVGQRGVYDVDRDMYRNAQTLGLSGQSPMGTVATTGTGATRSSLAISQIKKALGL